MLGLCSTPSLGATSFFNPFVNMFNFGTLERHPNLKFRLAESAIRLDAFRRSGDGLPLQATIRAKEIRGHPPEGDAQRDFQAPGSLIRDKARLRSYRPGTRAGR